VSEEKKVTVELSVYQAAAIRQVLFESTKGFTYDSTCIPTRIAEIRKVIIDIDNQIGEIVND